MFNADDPATCSLTRNKLVSYLAEASPVRFVHLFPLYMYCLSGTLIAYETLRSHFLLLKYINVNVQFFKFSRAQKKKKCANYPPPPMSEF